MYLSLAIEALTSVSAMDHAVLAVGRGFTGPEIPTTSVPVPPSPVRKDLEDSATSERDIHAPPSVVSIPHQPGSRTASRTPSRQPSFQERSSPNKSPERLQRGRSRLNERPLDVNVKGMARESILNKRYCVT